MAHMDYSRLDDGSIDVVAVVLLEHGVQELARWLVERREPSNTIYPNAISCAGGKVQPGEEHTDAAVREIFEETGLVVDPASMQLLSTSVAGHFTVSTYLASYDGDVPKNELGLVGREGQRLLWMCPYDILCLADTDVTLSTKTAAQAYLQLDIPPVHSPTAHSTYLALVLLDKRLEGKTRMQRQWQSRWLVARNRGDGLHGAGEIALPSCAVRGGETYQTAAARIANEQLDIVIDIDTLQKLADTKTGFRYTQVALGKDSSLSLQAGTLTAIYFAEWSTKQSNSEQLPGHLDQEHSYAWMSPLEIIDLPALEVAHSTRYVALKFVTPPTSWTVRDATECELDDSLESHWEGLRSLPREQVVLTLERLAAEAGIAAAYRQMMLGLYAAVRSSVVEWVMHGSLVITLLLDQQQRQLAQSRNDTVAVTRNGHGTQNFTSSRQESNMASEPSTHRANCPGNPNGRHRAGRCSDCKRILPSTKDASPGYVDCINPGCDVSFFYIGHFCICVMEIETSTLTPNTIVKESASCDTSDNAQSAMDRPSCIDGGAHTWATCTVCGCYVTGQEIGHVLCSKPGCNLSRPHSGPFCNCIEVAANSAQPQLAKSVSATNGQATTHMVSSAWPDMKPRSACIMYLGWSTRFNAVCFLLAQLKHSKLWCTPGGLIELDETPSFAALRETHEEVFGLTSHQASIEANRVQNIAQTRNALHGPYGRRAPHSAFILVDVLGDIDRITADFTPNKEIVALITVPLDGVNGAISTIEYQGRTLEMRNKLGVDRTAAAKAMAASWAGTTRFTSSDLEWRPRKSSIQARADAATVSINNSVVASQPPTRYLHSPALASGAGVALAALASEHESTQGSAKTVRFSPAATLIRLPVVTPTQTEWRPLLDQTTDFSGPLFDREYRLPLDDSFKWPPITHYAFHEDGGHIREAWRKRGYVSASIADRPTCVPPSDGCYHFIGQVYEFVQQAARAGLTIHAQTSHVECGRASWSAWELWPQNILNGSMKEAAEELLWMLCIGDKAMAEQPHTAHEHLLGPPTVVANANQHGGKDKTWCLWSRWAGKLQPTQIVPDNLRTSILGAATGSREVKMLKRSRTELPMAEALVSCIDACQWRASPTPRPANALCSEYASWRAAMHHNYGILSASFAPTLTAHAIANADGGRSSKCAIILPVASSNSGALFLIPLRGAAAFGILLDDNTPIKQAVEHASSFISCGIETQYMHGMRNSTGDIVVAVPWDRSPLAFASSPTALEAAHDSNAPAIWCSLNALDGGVVFEAAHFAVQRMTAMGSSVTHLDLNVGIWDRAKPVVARQRAAAFAKSASAPEAEHQWRLFLAAEAQRAAVMQEDLRTADYGDGRAASACVDVRTAADYAAEIPMPPQGLPKYDDPILLTIRAPQRPPPSHTDWLHRLPPQAVPPGFTRMPWTKVVRQWARRLIVDTRNTNMQYDAYCVEHGHAPEGSKRASDVVLGRGAAHEIPHADGIGSWNAFDVILERQEDGWFDAMDFTRPERRKWVFEYISQVIGTTCNQRMLSFLFHGVRWMIDAPRQLRILHNLARLDDRAAKVNDTLQKLADREYITLVPMVRVKHGFKADDPASNPLLACPSWDCPIGGLDKSDGTARVVGNMSAPPPGLQERNQPHGPPDGPPVISFNDLSGPKGGPKPGYEGPLPMPDPEIKPRPRHKYTAAAYLSYYASVNNTFVVTADDDMRHMFFQFFVADPDLHLCVWNCVMPIIQNGAQELWQVSIWSRTMNQGWRNASKVACEFAEEWLDGWRKKVDEFVVSWLPKQTPEMQHAYQTRLDKLGFEQARPFWAGVFTDNFDMTFCASDLAAAGFAIWKDMNHRANIWLQEHVKYGTCSDWIGGRCVLNGGFGCLTPSKRQRAIRDCERGIANQLTREEYESSNSFLAHVKDLCDWPADALAGVYLPSYSEFIVDTSLVQLTPNASTKYRQALILLRERPFAAFWSGVVDAYQDWLGSGTSTKEIRTHASDACTDPLPYPGNANPQPHVAGMVDGLFWRVRLEGEWRHKHITLTEAIGPAGNAVQTVPMFPQGINVLGNDATAALAAAGDSARALDLRELRSVLKREAVYREHEHTMWTDHWKGWGNGITDALSRDNEPMARRIAAAFGIKLTEIPPNDILLRVMRRTLVRTRPPPPDAFQILVHGIDDNTCVMLVNQSSTVAEVIERYEAEHDMPAPPHPAHAVYLVALGKAREPHLTMAQCGIDEKANLQLQYRVNGGMQDVPDPPSPLLGTAGDTADEAGVSSSDPPVASPIRSVSPSPDVEQLVPHCDTSSVSPTPKLLAHGLEMWPPCEVQSPRPGSPQPLSAEAARRGATRATAQHLAENPSEFAICGAKPELLTQLVEEVGMTKHAGIPKGTAAADAWGFKWMVAFGQATGTRWMRPRIGSAAIDPVTERWFTAISLFWIAQHIAPSAKRRELGFERGKPTSALLAVYGYRRVMKDCDRYIADMAQTVSVLKGLCHTYKAMFGQDAFIVTQAAIFDRDMLCRIAKACQDKSVANWSDTLHHVWDVTHKFKINTGTRTNEITEEAKGDDNIPRANFVWLDEHTLLPLVMTMETIQSRRNGHLLQGMSGNSKCDRLNLHWSKQKQYFRLDTSDTLNFAHAWQQYEIRFPCPVEMRKAWPAFSPSGDAVPFRSSTMAAQHRQLLTTAIGAAAAAERTLHSYRATLASMMFHRQQQGYTQFTPAVMQAHLRHKTLEALMSYAKITPQDFADDIAIAVSGDAGLTPPSHLPDIEPRSTLQEVEHIIDVIEHKQSTQGPTRALVSTVAHSGATAATGSASRQKPASSAVPKDAPRTSAINIVGHTTAVYAHDADSWGLIGSKVSLPNELWGENDGGHSACTVTHLIGRHRFAKGGTHVAYAVTLEDGEEHYAIRAAAILQQLDSRRRSALRKQPWPKAI